MGACQPGFKAGIKIHSQKGKVRSGFVQAERVSHQPGGHVNDGNNSIVGHARGTDYTKGANNFLADRIRRCYQTAVFQSLVPGFRTNKYIDTATMHTAIQ